MFLKKYIFPFNYDYSNKFLGIFEYKTLFPFCILAFFIAFIISKLNLDSITSINIFTLVFLPLFLIFNTKVFNESLANFLLCIIKHYINSNIYINKNR